MFDCYDLEFRYLFESASLPNDPYNNPAAESNKLTFRYNSSGKSLFLICGFWVSWILENGSLYEVFK